MLLHKDSFDVAVLRTPYSVCRPNFGSGMSLYTQMRLVHTMVKLASPPAFDSRDTSSLTQLLGPIFTPSNSGNASDVIFGP